MNRRTVTRRPWNLYPGDTLTDGRIVARVSMIPGMGMVIMRNGAAIRFTADSPSVTVTRTTH